MFFLYPFSTPLFIPKKNTNRDNKDNSNKSNSNESNRKKKIIALLHALFFFWICKKNFFLPLTDQEYTSLLQEQGILEITYPICSDTNCWSPTTALLERCNFLRSLRRVFVKYINIQRIKIETVRVIFLQ